MCVCVSYLLVCKSIRGNFNVLTDMEANLSLLTTTRCIGCGGFGTVHFGTYAGTPVAVKHIDINGTKEKEISLREVKALL